MQQFNFSKTLCKRRKLFANRINLKLLNAHETIIYSFFGVNEIIIRKLISAFAASKNGFMYPSNEQASFSSTFEKTSRLGQRNFKRSFHSK